MNNRQYNFPLTNPTNNIHILIKGSTTHDLFSIDNEFVSSVWFEFLNKFDYPLGLRNFGN